MLKERGDFLSFESDNVLSRSKHKMSQMLRAPLKTYEKRYNRLKIS
ncbi:hypothetical protein GCM10010416_80970 [Streptomyces caniferus]